MINNILVEFSWHNLLTYFQYDGDDENTFPRTEAGGWKAADKSDLLGTWKVNKVEHLVSRVTTSTEVGYNKMTILQGMEEVVDLGLAKSIGVSNFSISQIERICKVAKHKPVTNQVRKSMFI